MALGIFGITNSGLNLFVNLVILFLVVVWLALVAWTYLDARRRIDDSVLVACATGASLFPFVGSIVYTILRPPEYLEDTRERELEIRASELRVRQLEEATCPNCEHPIERTFLRCPNCRVRVKDPCESCGKPVDPRWALCPYCEAPTRSAQREAPRGEERRPSRAARGAARSSSGSSSPSASQPPPERSSRKPASAPAERKPRTPASSGEDGPTGSSRPARRSSSSTRSAKSSSSSSSRQARPSRSEAPRDES